MTKSLALKHRWSEPGTYPGLNMEKLRYGIDGQNLEDIPG